jgi:antitoxin component YwqK of YwqJK toxin-antitoxin module
MKKMGAMTLLCFWSIISFSQEMQDRDLVIEDYVITATLYHDNGTISQQGTYDLEGKPHGVWSSYDQSGNLTSTGLYKNGVKTGTWYVYNQSSLQEITYKDNRIAEVITWVENQRLVTDYK